MNSAKKAKKNPAIPVNIFHDVLASFISSADRYNQLIGYIIILTTNELITTEAAYKRERYI